MKLSGRLHWLIVSIVLLGIASSAQPTVFGTYIEPEARTLSGYFDKAEHKVDIRCVSVEDSTTLDAIARAGKRGVKIRLVVDTVTPSLQSIAAQSRGHITLHLLGASQKERYFAQNDPKMFLRDPFMEFPALSESAKQFLTTPHPESYAEVDYIQTWQGVPDWSATHWVGVSTMLTHTLNPDSKAGSSRFQKAWKHSRPAS